MAETVVAEGQTLESTTVQIYRTATVVKGGRRFSFAALVVVGDHKGGVGIGYGKAPGVPSAIEKAQKEARKSIVHITLQEGTIPHELTAKFGASTVTMVPAAPGTGVIAGATVRAVLEMAGIRDCLTKSYGSNNKKNLLKATLSGLQTLRSRDEVAAVRGVEIAETDVEQRLEAGRRFAPLTGVSTERMKGPQGLKPSKGGGRGRGGKGGGQRGRRDANRGPTSAPAPVAQGKSAEVDSPATTTGQPPAADVNAPGGDPSKDQPNSTSQ